MLVGRLEGGPALRRNGRSMRLAGAESSHADPGACYGKPVLGLTNGELFLVCFIVGAVLTAPLWPRLGEALARPWLQKGHEASNARARAKSAR
jgi:hypothetical protein